jgi:hypothetical protein
MAVLSLAECGVDETTGRAAGDSEGSALLETWPWLLPVVEEGAEGGAQGSERRR